MDGEIKGIDYYESVLSSNLIVPVLYLGREESGKVLKLSGSFNLSPS